MGIWCSRKRKQNKANIRKLMLVQKKHKQKRLCNRQTELDKAPENLMALFCSLEGPTFICENEKAANDATTRQLTMIIM